MDSRSTQILARKEMLCDQLEKLKNRMTGRDNSFYPFITNKSGKISERKLNSFINELASKPMKAVGSNSFFLSCHEADAKYKKLCKCFLYCAVQGIADYNEDHAYAERTSSLFSDIVRIAEHKNNIFFKSEEMLFDYEFEASMYEEGSFFSEYHEGGFFRYCDALYKLLTGDDIVKIIPPELYSKMLSTFLENEALRNGFDSAEEYAEYIDSYKDEYENIEQDWNDHLETLDETERAEIEKESQAYADFIAGEHEKQRKGKAAFAENYLKTVVSPEKYIESYLTFRKLFFSMGYYKCRYFFADIVLMVDSFLYDCGLSPMMDDDICAEFDSRTDRLLSVMKHRQKERSERYDKKQR